jgi:hypothetical protein
MKDGIKQSDPAPIVVNNGATWWQIATIGVIFTAVQGGYVWWTSTSTPDNNPAPVVIAEIVKRDGVVIDGPVAETIKAAAKSGDASYEFQQFVVGESPVTKTVVIGGDKPPVPVPPKPIPPDPVKPLPDGFAGEVAKQASGKPKADCIKLADNYQAVASIIAAGGITRLEDAVNEINKLNQALNLDKPTWTPFANWIGGEFNNKAQDLASARAMLRDTSTGLNFAGGK